MCGNRYDYNMMKWCVWRDMFTNRHFFWTTWGIWQTLKFLFNDTFWRLMKLPPWFPDWMNKRNLLITLFLGLAAWWFAELKGESAEYRGRWAAEEIGRIRVEQEAEIIEGKNGYCFVLDDISDLPKYHDTKQFGRVYYDKELYEKETGKRWPWKESGLNYIVPYSDEEEERVCPDCGVYLENNVLGHGHEIDFQTELCDLYGSAVKVDEEHGIKQEWYKE